MKRPKTMPATGRPKLLTQTTNGSRESICICEDTSHGNRKCPLFLVSHRQPREQFVTSKGMLAARNSLALIPRLNESKTGIDAAAKSPVHMHLGRGRVNRQQPTRSRPKTLMLGFLLLLAPKSRATAGRYQTTEAL